MTHVREGLIRHQANWGPSIALNYRLSAPNNVDEILENTWLELERTKCLRQKDVDLARKLIHEHRPRI